MFQEIVVKQNLHKALLRIYLFPYLDSKNKMAFKKDLETEKRWLRLLANLQDILGKRPKDLNGVLFLIGVQELGSGPNSFSKEEKEDLIHIATCKVLSLSGYYELEGLDHSGWPIWKLTKPIPHLDLMEQERLLKMNILDYFEMEIFTP